MPEWSIVISGTPGNVTFTPDPQPVFSGDIVSWSNRTNELHTIVIDPPSTAQPMPAQPFESSKPQYKVTNSVGYSCKDHPTEKGKITIRTAVFLLAMLAGMLTLTPSAKAADVQCSDLIGGELPTITEIERDDANRRVRGTLVTSGEKQFVAFVKGNRVADFGAIKPENITCVEQWLRTYRKDAPATAQTPGDKPTLPQPGPTIRARVGDLVQLTFLNLIDPLNFGGTDSGKCDEVQSDAGPVYPRTDPFPNCFHGSIFTNVHFHGTHTSPNSTGDNVFLEIVPSPRQKNDARTPDVTADSVRKEFEQFFGDCEAQLNKLDEPQLWPRIWTNLPEAYRKVQDRLLSAAQPALFHANQEAIGNGAFPQNYIGAFPYCFRLPVFNPDNGKLVMGQAPGTHWYHAHKHGSTTLNVSNGMTGVVIIEGAYDDEIEKAYAATGIEEKILVINQIGVTPRREGGTEAREGPYFSVNGRLQPFITMKPGEVQLWRIANTSARSGLIFQVPEKLQWRQLARDGVQLTDTNYKDSENKQFVIASGNRIDLLVKAPGEASGSFPVKVVSTIDPTTNNGFSQLLLNVKTGTTAQNMTFMDRSQVVFPPFLGDIKESEVKERKTLVFRTEPDTVPRFSTHTINGKRFTGEVGPLVLLNNVEEWKVINETFGRTIAHPFHIHINPFQIVELFDPNAKLPDGTPQYTAGTPTGDQCKIDPADDTTWKPCNKVKPPSNAWWDVFSIPSGNTFNGVKVPGYFKLRSRFVDYPGYYVLHCHILTHEDRGMMTVVYVAPRVPPFSHH